MTLLLQDQLVLITGGSRGIGRAIALAASRSGAEVILAARNAQDLQDAASEINGIGRAPCMTYSVDIGDPSQIRALFDQIAEKHRPLDALVCAAAVLGPVGPLIDTDFEAWCEVLRINCVGSAACAQLAAKQMVPQKKGRILFFSGGGQGPQPNLTAYSTSKGAIWRLTESLGAELAPHGVFVNAIAPGAVNTRFLSDLLLAGPERAGHDTYQRALKQRESGGSPPEKAADLALYLLSDSSAGLYGKVMSAIWDDYKSLTQLESISKSDLYAMRRVTP